MTVRTARNGLAAVLAIASVAVAGAGRAQLSPDGPELQVNTITTFRQFTPAVAVDSRGDFVIAWTTATRSGYSYNDNVHAQRFDARGEPLGGEFEVNTYTTYYQYLPDVAVVNSQGDFVVVWTSYGSGGTDHSLTSVHARRFDAQGEPLDDEFQVNTLTPNDQWFARVTDDGEGGFLVVWSSHASFGSDSDSGSIQARRFDAAGDPLGAEFQLNSYTTGGQARPAVVRSPQGGYIVVWDSSGSGGSDTDADSIQARRFDSALNPLGEDFQVNTYTTNSQSSPDVGVDGTGRFIVVWRSIGSAGTDTDWYSVDGRLFDAQGAAQGDEFQVNTYTTSFQANPSVAVDSRGNSLVAWISYGSGGPDTSSTSIQAQRYDPLGAPVGGESPVNSYTTDGQGYPAVSMDRQGNLVVAWSSYGSFGDDSSYDSIQVRRFDQLFRDGFETGDAGRWSLIEP